MNKFAILAIAALSITACNKSASTGGPAHDKFVQLCKEDPRAKQQGFDCSCQADIITAVLKNDEMDQLVNFLDIEKKDQTKAIELGKDPKYVPMFQKIAGVGLAIHDKCGDPSKATPAATATPVDVTPVEDKKDAEAKKDAAKK